MKKTHSANIGGTVFQVEEDAFEQLQAYLHSIEMHFRSYPDVADIVADIEGRIAEQLLQRELAPQVVRLGDVQRVIASMGRTEQFAEDTSQLHTETSLPGERRKLFRDPDNKVIAGVASGLAAYLGLPRNLVRVLFVLFAFFFGTAVVVYLLCWALAPMASSTTDKLQMRGRPLTLTSIDQGVRDGISSIPPRTRSAAVRGVTAVGALIHLVVVTLARILKGAAGVFVVGVPTLGLLFLTVSLVVALVNASAPPLHPYMAEFFATFGSWQQAFKLGLYLAAVIPLVVIIATGLKLFWGVSRVNTRGLAGLLAVWVISLLATAGMWSSSYPQLSQFWDEYPVKAEARQALERFTTLAATTSPFSDEQSRALLATLAGEYKRRRAEDDRYTGYYPYDDQRAYLAFEEQKLDAREQSNRRIIEAAKTYLDEKQLAVMQESMTRYSSRTQAALQARRDRIQQRELE